jgi:hypothetical protein
VQTSPLPHLRSYNRLNVSLPLGVGWPVLADPDEHEGLSDFPTPVHITWVPDAQNSFASNGVFAIGKRFQLTLSRHSAAGTGVWLSSA